MSQALLGGVSKTRIKLLKSDPKIISAQIQKILLLCSTQDSCALPQRSLCTITFRASAFWLEARRRDHRPP